MRYFRLGPLKSVESFSKETDEKPLLSSDGLSSNDLCRTSPRDSEHNKGTSLDWLSRSRWPSAQSDNERFRHPVGHRTFVVLILTIVTVGIVLTVIGMAMGVWDPKTRPKMGVLNADQMQKAARQAESQEEAATNRTEKAQSNENENNDEIKNATSTTDNVLENELDPFAPMKPLTTEDLMAIKLPPYWEYIKQFAFRTLDASKHYWNTMADDMDIDLDLKTKQKHREADLTDEGGLTNFLSEISKSFKTRRRKITT